MTSLPEFVHVMRNFPDGPGLGFSKQTQCGQAAEEQPGDITGLVLLFFCLCVCLALIFEMGLL